MVFVGTATQIRQVENRARTSADTRVGRPVFTSMGHQRVRACEKSRRSFFRRISVKRSKVSRVALPTQVRSTISSSSVAGVCNQFRVATRPTRSPPERRNWRSPASARPRHPAPSEDRPCCSRGFARRYRPAEPEPSFRKQRKTSEARGQKSVIRKELSTES